MHDLKNLAKSNDFHCKSPPQRGMFDIYFTLPLYIDPVPAKNA